MKINTNWEEILRQQKWRDGWLGTVATPRWFVYPSLLLWICAGAWWAGAFEKPETFEQCMLRNMRGEARYMITWAEEACKDRRVGREIDLGPATPQG